MNYVDSERLFRAIGRDGSGLSASQENPITVWIETHTSEEVVPRDHYHRAAVHFITDEARTELQNTLEEESFHWEMWDIERETRGVTGSGVIVDADDVPL